MYGARPSPLKKSRSASRIAPEKTSGNPAEWFSKEIWVSGSSTIAEQKQSDRGLGVLVHAEKLQLLYQQSFPAILASLFTGAMLCAILWPVQQTAVLIYWFSILAVSAIARILLFVHYWRTAPQREKVLTWERPYFITLLASSLIWGIGAVIIMPPESVLHQVVIYYFLMGMSGGAIAVYSAHRPMTVTAIAAVLGPSTAWFFLQGDLISIAMAIGAVVFFAAVVRAGALLSLALHKSFWLSHELKNAKDIAEKLARLDELTGLNNRRAFYEHGAIFSSYCRRNQDSLALIVMDIDHFKQVNDTLGHAAGDATLRQVGHVLGQNIRKSDNCARIGGEEFAILLMSTSLEEAAGLAGKLRLLIAETPVRFKEESFNITASFGVTTGSYELEALLRCADDALYRAKDNGRNNVQSVNCTIESNSRTANSQTATL